MKIQATEIVINSNLEESIISVISSQYNDQSSAKIIDNLVIDGTVGKSTFLNNPDCKYSRGIITYYFIASKVSDELTRVEVCYNIEYSA